MHKKTLTRVAAAVMLTASTLLTTAPIARALTAEQLCQKGRYDAAAKYAQCENKALGKLFATNDLAPLQTAVSKCRVKYTGTWLKLQARALGTGSTCDAQRFVDTGNGTVVDNLTGLEWEKKTDDGTVHDKDNTYNWFGAYICLLRGDGSNCNGLNGGGICFAPSLTDSCNWRLPTVAELQTILAEPFPCTTSPCIAAIFGPTAAGDYWSSTTLADNSDYAWGVYFGNATVSAVSYGVKTLNNSVRAVRGGL